MNIIITKIEDLYEGLKFFSDEQLKRLESRIIAELSARALKEKQKKKDK